MHKGYALRSRDWAYMRYTGGGAELYDMKSDPNQFTNLAMKPDHAEVVKQMDDALNRRLDAAGIKVPNQQSTSREQRK